jgi:hypothetical protein
LRGGGWVPNANGQLLTDITAIESSMPGAHAKVGRAATATVAVSVISVAFVLFVFFAGGGNGGTRKAISADEPTMTIDRTTPSQDQHDAGLALSTANPNAAEIAPAVTASQTADAAIVAPTAVDAEQEVASPKLRSGSRRAAKPGGTSRGDHADAGRSGTAASPYIDIGD